MSLGERLERLASGETGNVFPLPGADMELSRWLAKNAPYAITHPMTVHHAEAWDWFEGLRRGLIVAALVEAWARGLGKSTTVELGVSRICTKATRRFALYVSATQSAANGHVQSVATTMERVGVERLLNKYGQVRGWRQDMLRAANGFNVLAVGLDAGTRGVKLDEVRPDLIILDDVDELHDSADAIKKKIETITQTILPSGSNDCAVCFFQNPIHANSVMSRLLRGELDMLRIRNAAQPIPAIEGLEYEEREDPESGRMVYAITAGAPVWAGKPISVCEAEINRLGLQSFLRECQHELGVGGLMFPDFAEQRNGEDWHVIDPFPIPDYWNSFGAHDFGTAAPCAFGAAVMDEFGDIYLVGEYYKAGVVSSDQAQAVLELLERLDLASPVNPDNRDGQWVTDLSQIAFDYANTFPPINAKDRVLGEYPVEVWWRRGLPCVRADKGRIAGWHRIKEWLAAVRYVDGKPKPRIQIFRGAAPNLVKQLSTAMASTKRFDDLDAGFREDHALDMLQYLIMTQNSPAAAPNSAADSYPFWGAAKKEYYA